jgi:hypothetical protein
MCRQVTANHLRGQETGTIRRYPGDRGRKQNNWGSCGPHSRDGPRWHDAPIATIARLRRAIEAPRNNEGRHLVAPINCFLRTRAQIGYPKRHAPGDVLFFQTWLVDDVRGARHKCSVQHNCDSWGSR